RQGRPPRARGRRAAAGQIGARAGHHLRCEVAAMKRAWTAAAVLLSLLGVSAYAQAQAPAPAPPVAPPPTADAPAPTPGAHVVTGQAPVVGGNAAGARERALDDAIKQAVD